MHMQGKITMADFQIRNEEIESALKDIARKIDSTLPSGWGFMLTIQSYGENGSTFYISNCEREGMIQLLEEMIGKLKNGEARP